MNMLSIILATYNEIDNIAPLIYMVNQELTNSSIPYQIVICDDNSPDGTGALADKLAEVFPTVKVVHRPTKLGLGSAYRDAEKHCDGDFVLIMDADFGHDPADIPRLVARQAETGADIVAATRYQRGSDRSVVGWPLKRFLTSCGANYLFTFAGLRGVSDITGSFRLYRASTFRAALNATSAPGYAIQPEILTQAVAQGASVAEVPITFVDRLHGRTKFGIKEIIGVVGCAVRLWLWRPWPAEDQLQSKRPLA